MRRIVFCAGVALLAGCAAVGPFDSVNQGPYYVPANHVGEASLGGLRRVVVLPIYGGSVAPVETVAALDPVLVEALQHQNRFEIVCLSREESLRRFRVDGFSSAAALPHDLLKVLQEAFAADGVLFVDLTVFSAYRPLAIGLRSRLAAIQGGRLVWTFDEVFSAENPAVVNSARLHVLGTDGVGIPGDLSRSVLQSPGRFAGYAAAAMFATLPPVVAPPPPVKKAGR